ncbi:galactose-specific lectin nattectin-like [Synchiropus splendidus]|uniref:galactose-specific lectin nattectin-like n=1 Tax=Synchiropus splendidus TaxID=270530 RepID=UPI00237E96DA|nr:galactose-specific lectin nattectin-like [Synchiropus splendidus]
MSSSSLLLLLACLCCAVLSATSVSLLSAAVKTSLNNQDSTVQSHKCCFCDPVRCCRNGWTQFKGRCFMYHHSRKDWVSAEKHCQSLGGNLASILKAGEHFFVRNMIHRVTGYYNRAWIGGHDTVQEGVWLWADGSPCIYKRWANNEPNNYKHEHCMEMNWNGNYWNDRKCSTKMSFVCSMDL